MSSSAEVPGSVYNRYSASEVLDLLNNDEPVLEDSDDDLGLDLGSGDEM